MPCNTEVFQETHDLALEHITVLDLTRMLSGPYGNMLLADLGARTINGRAARAAAKAPRRLLENDPDYARRRHGRLLLSRR